MYCQKHCLVRQWHKLYLTLLSSQIRARENWSISSLSFMRFCLCVPFPFSGFLPFKINTITVIAEILQGQTFNFPFNTWWSSVAEMFLRNLNFKCCVCGQTQRCSACIYLNLETWPYPLLPYIFCTIKRKETISFIFKRFREIQWTHMQILYVVSC